MSAHGLSVRPPLGLDAPKRRRPAGVGDEVLEVPARAGRHGTFQVPGRGIEQCIGRAADVIEVIGVLHITRGCHPWGMMCA